MLEMWRHFLATFPVVLIIGSLLSLCLLLLVLLNLLSSREIKKIKDRQATFKEYATVALRILNPLLVTSLVISRYLPRASSVYVVMLFSGLLTILAPYLLFTSIKKGRRKSSLRLFVVFFSATVAPIFFFGSLYSVLCISNLWDAFYFSATTFVTLGFRRPSISTYIQKAIAGLEGFLGYLYLGIFIAIIPHILSDKSRTRTEKDLSNNYKK
ncbi:hypothetical protein K9M78_02800 [Candidatus Bipolaricaulota bacterium]|nr:hypothetical protein [Candidatus Bipolaricaulota bacterium]